MIIFSKGVQKVQRTICLCLQIFQLVFITVTYCWLHCARSRIVTRAVLLNNDGRDEGLICRDVAAGILDTYIIYWEVWGEYRARKIDDIWGGRG